MYLQVDHAEGLQVVPRAHPARVRSRRQRDRRPERLGQVERHRRGPVGARRAVAGRRARPGDAGRDLRRRARPAGEQGRRGRARARRQRGRSWGSAPPRSRSSAGSTATGEGEYRLAGARCRLVDVIEVLSDTGLGKEMHSVISQGRVESIVTSKPRDRRLLIEEAAGLGKHRKRRRRAQLKLARTQDNLDRALDVEREARTRLRPLKRQAEAAELHARLERQTLEARWELARDDLRVQLEALPARRGASRGGARPARAGGARARRPLAARREAAEEALASRSAQREELSRRCFVAQSAAERVSVPRRRGARRGVRDRGPARARHGAARRARAASECETSDPRGGRQRIAALEATLAELEREREQELARQLAELERQLRGGEHDRRASATPRSSSARDAARAGRGAGRAGADGASAQAERAVEEARREAARVGGELAAVNQFLRSQTGRPGRRGRARGRARGRSRLRAGASRRRSTVGSGRRSSPTTPPRARCSTAPVPRAAGRCSRRRPPRPEPPRSAGRPPTGDAERLADHVQGPEPALDLARALLRDTWVVDALDAVPPTFAGVAVTRAGRVWSALAGSSARPRPSARSACSPSATAAIS